MAAASVTDLLTRLVAVRTHNPGGDEPKMAALLAEALRERGPDTVELIEHPREDAMGASVLARWGQPRLLVNAHLDTVPPNAGWAGDPFVARVDEKRLTALGAADTKGAIAAILCALDEVKPRDTAVLFSGDEELYNTCMRAFVDRPPLRLGPGGVERAIVCEPTSLSVGVRHRGVMAIDFELVGQGGHSSRADTMPRPIADLARLAVALDDWGRAKIDEGPPGFPGMCMNVAKLDGGVAFNVVPERARLSISLRPPPGCDVGKVRAELEAIHRRVLPASQMIYRLDNPPFATRDAAGFRDLLGERVATARDLAFWTEAAFLAEAGVDAVVIGPGDIAHAHAAEEYVPLDELEAARQMFVNAFRSTRGAG